MGWNSTLTRKTPLKAKGVQPRPRAPRMTANRKIKKADGRDAAMLAACRSEDCYLGVPGVCLGAAGRETVVPCHSNQSQHGKGMGIKAADRYTVPGCMACHRWLDQGSCLRATKNAAWDSAFSRWAPVRAKKNPALAGTSPGVFQPEMEVE